MKANIGWSLKFTIMKTMKWSNETVDFLDAMSSGKVSESLPMSNESKLEMSRLRILSLLSKKK